jgi:hypothetical protein
VQQIFLPWNTDPVERFHGRGWRSSVRQMALNLIRTAPGKDSLRLRRKVAAWDDEFLASLIAA